MCFLLMGGGGQILQKATHLEQQIIFNSNSHRLIPYTIFFVVNKLSEVTKKITKVLQNYQKSGKL